MRNEQNEQYQWNWNGVELDICIHSNVHDSNEKTKILKYSKKLKPDTLFISFD